MAVHDGGSRQHLNKDGGACGEALWVPAAKYRTRPVLFVSLFKKRPQPGGLPGSNTSPSGGAQA
jgi:hypothetical protein